eukprot:m.307729 g.307729  ORF g.307729 m.307729 type:complete len:257 (-) comp16463_c4_seq1:127-897(-)
MQSAVDDFAKKSGWYKQDVTADKVKEMLEGLPNGNFIIRNSVSEPQNFVLTYIYDNAIKVLHIQGSSKGVMIPHSKKFSCLTDLVKALSDHPGAELACPLVGQLPSERSGIKRSQFSFRRRKEKQPSKIGREVQAWKGKDVKKWLASIDMAKYASTFKKDKIDGASLLNLAASDLRQMGVMNSSDQDKILKELETLKLSDGASSDGRSSISTAGSHKPYVDIDDLYDQEQEEELASRTSDIKEPIAEGIDEPDEAE